MNYDYDVTMDEKNHIIAHMGGKKCLIDTGSPVTLCDEVVEFGAAKSSLKPKVAGLDVTSLLGAQGWSVKNIRKLSGLDIDALVGTDLLSTNRWFVDPFQKTLTVGFLPKGKVTPIVSKFQGSSPIIECQVNGEPCEMLLDTGANVNFVSKMFTGDMEKIGDHDDFYPTIGKFTVPLYRAPYKVFGHTFGNVKFAELPPALDTMIELVSTFGGAKMNGIAGMEILNHGGLGFDLRSGVVVFTPREA
jgi:hypothetical protein